MVGVLKARVGTSWVDLGSVGPPGPQGPSGNDTLNYWNSSYGVVAIKRNSELPTTSGGALQIAASGQSGVTFAESFTAVENRRYRFYYYCRAWGINGGTAVAASVRMLPYVDGVDRQVNLNDPWTSKPATAWGSIRAEFVMNCVAGGTGADLSPGLHTFQFVAITDAAGTNYFWNTGSHFVVEDMGPLSPAIPAPPPAASTAWIPLSTGWPLSHNVSYRKVNDEVEFRGAMSWTNPGVSNPMTTMPTGFRPPIRSRFQTWLLDTGTQIQPIAGNQLGIGVEPSGTISIYGLGATAGFLDLSNVRYSITP